MNVASLAWKRIKLDRANHHLVELKRTEREFWDNDPCGISYDTETKPGRKLAKLVLKTPPPEIVHVLAGELIYQLRSALDQTAVAFARLSKGPAKPKEVYFPTGNSFKGFAASCRKTKRTKSGTLSGNLRFFDMDLRKAILRTRPYDGGNQTLRSLFYLANIDKHMELIAVSAEGALVAFTNHIVQGNFILDEPGGIVNLKDGILFADLPPEGSVIPKHPNAKIHVTGEITLGEVPLVGLVASLEAMVEEVRRIHTGFEDLLIARGDMSPRKPAAQGAVTQPAQATKWRFGDEYRLK